MHISRVFASATVLCMLLAGNAAARHGEDDIIPEVVDNIPDIEVPEIPAIDHSGPGGGDLPSAIENIPEVEIPDLPEMQSGSDVADRAGVASERDDHSGHGDGGMQAETLADRVRDDSGESGKKERDPFSSPIDQYAEHDKKSGDQKTDGGRAFSKTEGGDDRRADRTDNSGKSTSGTSSSGKGSSKEDSSGKGSSGGGSSEGSGSGSNSGSGTGSDDSGSGDDSSGSGSGKADSSGSGGGDDSDTQYARSGGPVSYELDREGQSRRSGEVIFLSTPEELALAQQLGFEVISGKKLLALGGGLARIRVRDSDNIEQALAALRQLAPRATASANYVYRPAAGVVQTKSHAKPKTIVAPQKMPVRVATEAKSQIGVIDTGADMLDKQARFGKARSFASTPYTPRPHGTAVASIASADGFRVDVADVFDVDARGSPIASADSIARAIDWLVSRQLPIINISVEGPSSPVLEAVIKRAVDSGVIIVAAAGNDGPAAPPVYPAAYDGVIGVTAVDKDGRIYRRANRGKYVDFAALGVKVPVDLGGKEAVVTGTSYAAPAVAAAAARLHLTQAKPGAEKVFSDLKSKAVDLGPVGRDPIYGWGVLNRH